MSYQSIVEHKANMYYVALREDYLKLCMQMTYRKYNSRGELGKASPYCKSFILSIAEHWTNTKRDQGLELSFCMTLPQWIDAMYGMFKRNAIIDSLDELLGEGLLPRTPFKSPRGGRDLYMYTLNYQEINKRMRELPDKAPEKVTPPPSATFTNQPSKEQRLQINLEQGGKVNDQSGKINVATFTNQPCSSSPTLKSKPLLDYIDSNIITNTDSEGDDASASSSTHTLSSSDIEHRIRGAIAEASNAPWSEGKITEQFIKQVIASLGGPSVAEQLQNEDEQARSLEERLEQEDALVRRRREMRENPIESTLAESSVTPTGETHGNAHNSDHPGLHQYPTGVRHRDARTDSQSAHQDTDDVVSAQHSGEDQKRGTNGRASNAQITPSAYSFTLQPTEGKDGERTNASAHPDARVHDSHTVGDMRSAHHAGSSDGVDVSASGQCGEVSQVARGGVPPTTVAQERASQRRAAGAGGKGGVTRSRSVAKPDLFALASPGAQAVVTEWRGIFKSPQPVTKTLVEHAESLAEFQPVPGEIKQCRLWMYATDWKQWYKSHGMHLGDVLREFGRFRSISEAPTTPPVPPPTPDVLSSRSNYGPRIIRSSFDDPNYTMEGEFYPEKKVVSHAAAF